MNIPGVSAATNYAVTVKGEKSSKIQGTEKTARGAMTDGFIERIKAYAKEDAKKGVYMSEGFIQMRLAHMKQYVSPDRSGPKNQVMSAIQAALKEPHPMLQALEKMLEKLSGGCSANLKISSVQQAAEIYAPNGENIASYNSLGEGWTDIQTKEEHKYFDETASIYLKAFREARAEMKAAQTAPAAETSVNILA